MFYRFVLVGHLFAIFFALCVQCFKNLVLTVESSPEQTWNVTLTFVMSVQCKIKLVEFWNRVESSEFVGVRDVVINWIVHEDMVTMGTILVSAAELSNFFSVIAVLLCFCAMILFITRSGSFIFSPSRCYSLFMFKSVIEKSSI